MLWAAPLATKCSKPSAGACLPRSARFDVVGRLNGDEFVIMLVNVESADIVHSLAVKITQALTPKIVVNSHELFLTTSTGIALYPQDGDTPEELLKKAEIALLSVKSGGRNGIQFFYRSD